MSGTESDLLLTPFSFFESAQRSQRLADRIASQVHLTIDESDCRKFPGAAHNTEARQGGQANHTTPTKHVAEPRVKRRCSVNRHVRDHHPLIASAVKWSMRASTRPS